MDSKLTNVTAVMSKQTLHALVGAVIVVLGVVAIIVSQSGGRGTSSGGYELIGQFGATDGVAVGTKVLLVGIQIGEVTRQFYDRESQRAVLHFTIRSGMEIPIDSVALIVSDGMLGGKYIKIQPGGELEMMRAGETFEYVQDSIVFEEILEKVILNAERRRGGAKTPEPAKRSPNEARLQEKLEKLGGAGRVTGSAEDLRGL
ncbi:MAG: MlaD family protein [Alphaproteobacteria bacterium]|nr:MlaD family protein [Alphaproteobacteria bacterium]